MKTLRNFALIAALSLAFGAPSFALDLPEHSAKDHRVRYVEYDPANVIQLDAVVGVATHIQLEKGEEYVYHVFGDSEAYEFTHKLNHLFFKPKAEQADTNLTVITNLREYTFRISYHSERGNKALYKLVLRYPESEAAKVAAIEEQHSVERAWNDGQPVAFNWQTYMKSGALDLAPVHAWDDGRHTSMQFSPHAELPAIYYVDADGQESIANYHMADAHTVVLHRTASKWYLRSGSRIAAIHNQGFGQIPKPAETGTISSEVVRVVEGETHPAPIPVPQPPARPQADVFQTSLAFDLSALSALPVSAPVPASVPAESAPVKAPEPEPSPVVAAPVSSAPTPGTEVQPQPAPSEASVASSSPASASGGSFHVISGDVAIAPKKITISEGQTAFQFPSPDMPMVKPLDKAGKEMLAGMHVEPENTIVVHAESDAWRLSKGTSNLLLEKR